MGTFPWRFDLCHLRWRTCDDGIVDVNHNLDVLFVVPKIRRMSNHVPESEGKKQIRQPIVKLLWRHPDSVQGFLHS